MILKQLCLLVLFFALAGCDKEAGDEMVSSDSPDAGEIAEPIGATDDDGQSDSEIIGGSPESPRIPVDPEYPEIPIPGPVGPGGTDVVDTGGKCPKNCENLIFTKCYANCKHCGTDDEKSACRDMCLNSCVHGGQGDELEILTN